MGTQDTGPFSQEKTAAILRQVEYYFSDSSLARDKFLLERLEEGNGSVSIALLCTFTRMRLHLELTTPEKEKEKEKTKEIPEIPQDLVKKVADVLRKSTFLNVSDDGERVSRKVELKDSQAALAEADARSLYAGPFPWNITLDEIHDFFAKVGNVKSIIRRKHADTKDFMGSVYVEFASEEEARRVMGETVVCCGATLKFEFKKEHEERYQEELKVQAQLELARREERMLAQKEGSCKDDEMDAGEEGSRPFTYDEGVIVGFKLVDTLKSDAPAGEKEKGRGKGGVDENTKESTAEVVDKDAEGEKPAEGEKEEDMKDAEAGEEGDGEEEGKEEMAGRKCVLAREDIQLAVESFGAVKFVDFLMGATSGFVRMSKPEEAARIVKEANKGGEGEAAVPGLDIGDHWVATFRAVEGEEEKEYWAAIRTRQERKKAFGNSRGRGGYSRGFGGRGRGFGRGFSRGFGGDRGGRFGGRRGGRGEFRGRGGSHKRFMDNDEGPREAKAAKIE